jgi:hypothetical protein
MKATLTEAMMLMTRDPKDPHAGGPWQLPSDATCALVARTTLTTAMTRLALPGELIADGALAVSELATNAYLHSQRGGRLAVSETFGNTYAHAAPLHPYQPVTVPELWIWARTHPAPQLVVSVFDTNQQAMPKQADVDLMAENGRGLAMVDAVSADWGIRWSRSRLTPHPIPGKAVWFALPLHEPWSPEKQAIPPGHAAHQLQLTLAARGINGTRHSDDKGISIIQIPGIDIWVKPKSYLWRDPLGTYVSHPLLDLQETTENLIHHIEASGTVPLI